MAPRPARTSSSGDQSYTDWLVASQQVWWKRVLHVQWPYQEKLRRQRLGRTLDIGCGIGRNLQVLEAGSVGTDTNPTSVEVARRRGLDAVLPEELAEQPEPAQFDALLLAHLLEHLPLDASEELVRGYLRYLRPGGQVQIVCPQQRGYASDPTHVHYLDAPQLEALCTRLGLEVVSSTSFPFPAWAGRLFVYNEFWVRARYDGSTAR